MTILEARSLTIGYAPPKTAPHVVAHDLDLELRGGELVCLLGQNGAGKSTLMRTLAGMQPALGGRAFIDGFNIALMQARERARRVGVVLTDRIDVGHLVARDLVGLGRYPHTDWLGRLTSEDYDKISWAIEAVGALDLSDRPVNELSDGERQKVLIARVLCQDTNVIVLDEPTAFLDLPRRVEIVALLRRLARVTGKAILMSTHDLDLAIRNADRCWLLFDRRIEIGVPEALVLEGAFGRVFERKGILFDRGAGAFTVQVDDATPIALCGTGLVGTWTTRALERIGYEVRPSAAGAADIQVRIEGDDGRPLWRLVRPEAEDVFESLDSLLGCLSPPYPDRSKERS